MARHTINISLSEKSVNEAIRQLQQYKNWLIKKTSQLVKELAEVGIPVIDEKLVTHMMKKVFVAVLIQAITAMLR